MINLLIGPPGGGKSYEAVVFHVLPALQDGRKVITNLPIDVERMSAVVPGTRHLLELRIDSKEPGCNVFGSLSDYGDAWREPRTQRGALYVIDEAHKAIPRNIGAGLRIGDKLQAEARGRAIDEWFAEHRHEGADVLLLTQSYGKLSKAVTDQVQVTYRVKKGTLFGDSSKYIRKVQDGVRGDVLSETERTYEARFYSLYKSHTRSVAAVIESDAANITPAFLKWKRASRLFLAVGFIALAWSLLHGSGSKQAPRAGTSTAKLAQSHALVGSPSLPKSQIPDAKTASGSSDHLNKPVVEADKTVAQRFLEPSTRTPGDAEPLQGLGIHIVGSVKRANGNRSYLFATTVNAQLVGTQTSAELLAAGYAVQALSECVARLSFGGKDFYVRCDRVRPPGSQIANG